MKPIEIVFKDFLIKFGFYPLVITISMVLLVIIITIYFVIREVRRS